MMESRWSLQHVAQIPARGNKIFQAGLFPSSGSGVCGSRSSGPRSRTSLMLAARDHFGSFFSPRLHEASVSSLAPLGRRLKFSACCFHAEKVMVELLRKRGGAKWRLECG